MTQSDLNRTAIHLHLLIKVLNTAFFSFALFSRLLLPLTLFCINKCKTKQCCTVSHYNSIVSQQKTHFFCICTPAKINFDFYKR